MFFNDSSAAGVWRKIFSEIVKRAFFSWRHRLSEQCQTLILQRLCVQFFTLDTALLSANGILVGLTFLSSRSGCNCNKTHKTFSSMCWWVNTRRWFCFHPRVLKDGCHPEHLTRNRKQRQQGLVALFPEQRGKPDQPKHTAKDLIFNPKFICLPPWEWLLGHGLYPLQAGPTGFWWFPWQGRLVAGHPFFLPCLCSHKFCNYETNSPHGCWVQCLECWRCKIYQQ